MADGPLRFDDPIYLICEGPADAYLVRRVLERENLNGFSINGVQGYQHFAKRVTGLRASSDWPKLKRLVIIGDNDLEPASRWQNACAALTGEGLLSPEKHGDIADGLPSTGIFMMPRGNAVGALETLLVEAIFQARGELVACLQQLDECPATDCDTWDEVKRAKMQFQTAISITCRDDPSAGAAHIWSKIHNPIPATSPVFDELAGFLRRVAEL